MKKLFIIILLGGLAVDGYSQILNAGLENWHKYKSGKDSLQSPDNWYSADSLIFYYGNSFFPGTTFQQQLFQSTDSHSGTYAAMLVTKKQGTIGTFSGILANANPSVNIAVLLAGDTAGAFSYSGGTPVSARMQSVSAWVKYTPVGSDQGEIFAQAVLSGRGAGGKDSVVGSGSIDFGAESAYIKQYANIYYTDPTVVPDKILIVFKSSAGKAFDGSTLYVDDIDMSTALAVPAIQKQQDIVTIYPNPAKGMIHLHAIDGEIYNFRAYSVSGQLMAHKTFSGNDVADVGNLPDGIYLVDIADSKGLSVQQSQLTINR